MRTRSRTVRAVGLWFNLLWVGFVGSVFWVVNTETMAIYAGSEGMNPFLVGLFCTIGQNAAYIFLYLGGDQLIQRWGWLNGKVNKVRERLKDDTGRGFCGVTILAALTGVPPIVGMVALAPGFNIPMRTVFMITLPCRAIRFTILAAFGTVIVEYVTELFPWLFS